MNPAEILDQALTSEHVQWKSTVIKSLVLNVISELNTDYDAGEFEQSDALDEAIEALEEELKDDDVEETDDDEDDESDDEDDDDDTDLLWGDDEADE